MTRPQSPPDPYARPQRPVPGDSHRSALVVALIGAAATIVAALIGLFVQLSGDTEQRASGPSLGAASPAPSAPASSVAPLSSVPPTTPAASQAAGGPAGTPAAAPPSTAPAPVGLPEQFLGRWQGYAEEVDATRTDHYRVTVELGQGTLRDQVGSVHYAMESSDCYGTVTLTEVAGTDQVTLGESIQSGDCVTNGRIILTLRPGDTVDFAYETIKRDGTRQSVKAGLERVA
ncbi:hypothetical protein ACFV06_01820 [Streptomyces sp. NPDC059618]|uniref:hypothetical protein n=1 Tax=Streptomyces sp. NPDC059618 TaxID=3346887 RepID=UPI0036B49B55